MKRIDPQKDHAILEITRFKVMEDGSRKMIVHMEATHEQADGRWWPKKCVTRFAKGGGEEIEFSKVEFDRREHPSVLGPEILGIPPGLNAVDRIHHDPDKGPLKLGRYVGDGKVVSMSDWHQSYAAQIDPAPLEKYISNVQRLGSGEYPRWWSAGEETLGLENASYTPDLWEAYVRRWIIRHSHNTVNDGAETVANELTPAQVEAAWGILKDCRKRAAPIVQRMKEQSAGKTSRAAATMVQNEGTEPQTVPAANADASRTTSPNRFQRELNKIFETLKTRLNGLLTSKQGKTAATDGPPATVTP